jgi:hypothetical protein
MDKIKSYSEYHLNEEFSIAMLKSMPVLAKALTNPFIISLAPQVIAMMNADLDDEKTWMGPYKKIFQKACIKFGGGKAGDIGKTCNKPQTLQKLAEFLFDPKTGLIDSKAISVWIKDTTDGAEPDAVQYEYTTADMDPTILAFTEVLKRTGVPPADLKKTGTYLLSIAIPVMKSFYKVEDIEKMKSLSNGQLIDQAKFKELIEGGKAGGEIDLED